MPETSLIPAGKQAIKICGMLNHAANMETDRSQFCSWGPQGFLATMSQINGVDKQGSLFNFLLSVFENISNITMFIS